MADVTLALPQEDPQKDLEMEPVQEGVSPLGVELATTLLVLVFKVEGTIKEKWWCLKSPTKGAEDDPLVFLEPKVITFGRVNKGKQPSKIIDVEVGIKLLEKVKIEGVLEEEKVPPTPITAQNLLALTNEPHKDDEGQVGPSGEKSKEESTQEGDYFAIDSYEDDGTDRDIPSHLNYIHDHMWR